MEGSLLLVPVTLIRPTLAWDEDKTSIRRWKNVAGWMVCYGDSDRLVTPERRPVVGQSKVVAPGDFSDDARCFEPTNCRKEDADLNFADHGRAGE